MWLTGLGLLAVMASAGAILPEHTSVTPIVFGIRKLLF